MKHSTAAVTVNHVTISQNQMNLRLTNAILKFVTKFLVSATECTPTQLIVWKEQIKHLIAVTLAWIALLLSVHHSLSI